MLCSSQHRGYFSIGCSPDENDLFSELFSETYFQVKNRQPDQRHGSLPVVTSIYDVFLELHCSHVRLCLCYRIWAEGTMGCIKSMMRFHKPKRAADQIVEKK